MLSPSNQFFYQIMATHNFSKEIHLNEIFYCENIPTFLHPAVFPNKRQYYFEVDRKQS